MTRLALAALVVSATLPFVAAQAQMPSELERALDTSVEQVVPALSPDADPVASANAASPAREEDVVPPPPVSEPSIAVPATPLEAILDTPALASAAPSAGPASPPDFTPAVAPTEPTVPPAKPRAMATPAKASTLKIINGSEVPVMAVTITAEAKAVGHAGPLAPQAEAVLKLPKLKGCQITVAAALEGGALSELGAVDVCKVKLVRLTD